MKRILIAEDNDSNYILMTYTLKGKYELDRARNGKEAIQKVNEGAFDLVLMDIKMPIMDGLEATEAIKKVHPDLPVVALTANVFDVDKENAMRAGCDAFIPKPVNRDNCLETIEQLTK